METVVGCKGLISKSKEFSLDFKNEGRRQLFCNEETAYPPIRIMTPKMHKECSKEIHTF